MHSIGPNPIHNALLITIVSVGCAPIKGRVDSGTATQPGLDDPTARMWTRAGAWYPEDPNTLDRTVQALLDYTGASRQGRARALLTPHAALSYSGAVAAEAWARVEVPESIIILAPSHWDEGEPLAIWTEGPWLVPGHAIQIDRSLTTRLAELDPTLVSDRAAFDHHEVEMNLPFLQAANPDAHITVVSYRDNQDWTFLNMDLAQIEAAGQAVAQAVREREAEGDDVMLLITTDLTHYQPRTVADRDDPAMLDLIATLDVEGLYTTVREQHMTICGEVPAAVGMVALRELGVGSFDMTTRDTSDRVTGDPTDVVGYPAGVVLR